MKTKTTWNGKMAFAGACGENSLIMDSKPPLGDAKGMTPKELVSLGVSGCTAMDVIALLKKYKQNVEGFEVDSEISQSEPGKHPIVFKEVLLTFKVTGPVEKEKLIEAVTLSQTKFCGVSAMISLVAPIHYKVFLNGEMIHEGQAHFSE